MDPEKTTLDVVARKLVDLFDDFMSVAVVFQLHRLRTFVPRSQNGALDAVKSQMISHPQPICRALKLVVCGTVDIPLAQHVACHRCTNFQFQHAVVHPVIHLGYLWIGLVWMRDEIEFDDASPLNVLVASLMGFDRAVPHHLRVLDPRNHEITETLPLAIECAHVPAHVVIDEREWNDLPLASTA